MTARSPRLIGIALGLVTAAAVLAVMQHRQPPARPTGATLSDCDGAIRTLAIHYVQGAEPALAAYRGFLPQLPGDITVCVLCPAAPSFEELRREVGPVMCKLRPIVVNHSLTAWSRDRWISLRPANPGSPTTLLHPRDEAGADLWPARAGDARAADDLAGALSPGVAARRSDLFFDGGDFVVDEHTAFIAPGVIRRNLQHTVSTRQELLDALSKLTRRRVVLLDDAPDHHAGMFIMAVGNKTVLVGDPSLARGLSFPDLPGGADFTPATQRRFDSVAENSAAAGYRVVRIPLAPAADGRTFLTYLNVIIDDRAGARVVYMPIYRGAEPLNAEAERVWRELGYDVRPVDCTDAYVHFGSLRCLVSVVERHDGSD